MTLQFVTKVLTEEQKRSMKKRAEKGNLVERDFYGRKITKSVAEKSKVERDFYGRKIPGGEWAEKSGEERDMYGRKMKTIRPWAYK